MDRTLTVDGVLWTWTVQRFPPKSPPYVPPPGGFQPFALGFVEVAGDERVAALLDIDDLSSVHIGMPLRVSQEPGRVPHASLRAGSTSAGEESP